MRKRAELEAQAKAKKPEKKIAKEEVKTEENE